jgi:protein-S-isoprenylcysteine O-methyltransferase Ste14
LEQAVRAIFAVTLFTQLLLVSAFLVTRLRPSLRIWPPPPGRRSWQLYFVWGGAWLHLSGAFLLAILDWNGLGLPAWLRFGLGLPLIVLGQLVIFWGARTLSAHTTLGLGGPFVRGGPYAWSRNPQYIGAITYLLGLGLLSGSGWTLAACLGAMVWYVSAPFGEEPFLRAEFGPSYDAYCREVPRFLGRPRAARSAA